MWYLYLNLLKTVNFNHPQQYSKHLLLLSTRDLPCPMTLMEMKSFFRIDDIIASATQQITVLEASARSGQGLMDVLHWLDSTIKE
ncbi:hypothetical protein JZ751_027523 [Albula glossodonta]|uniref:Uncharacterized protein n=1 Tax=Albula glossodonta TaxID=121402 RepID=A0A8T2NG09_9TELE|nr:hypothetical protein JZ751_027523 [Albula glossodonta]